MDWKPIAGGDKKIAGYLRKLKQPELYEKIQAANQEALSRILSAQPVLVGMSTAGEAIPGMTPTTILHAGAVMGGLIYEGLAKDLKEAEELAASGKITFSPCHHHNAVGPMAGIVTYSMPVWHVVNKTFGIDAYCTMNEGLGKVLRFGACDQEVFDRLHRMREVYYPVLKEALELHGEIDLKVMIAQALQMGDEGHNRNKAGTSLLLREIAQDIYKPACKSTMDAIFDIPYSTVVATMCRNGTEFGIRIAGLGKDQWFTAPSEFIRGLYFPGFTEKDANRDVGDSCITETTRHRHYEGHRDRHPSHHQHRHRPQGLRRGTDRRRSGQSPRGLLHQGHRRLRRGLGLSIFHSFTNQTA